MRRSRKGSFSHASCSFATTATVRFLTEYYTTLMYRGHVAVTIIIQRWLDSPYRRKRRGAERREEGLVPEAIALRPELLEAWFRDGTKLTCLDRREIHKRLGRFSGEIAPSSLPSRLSVI